MSVDVNIDFTIFHDGYEHIDEECDQDCEDPIEGCLSVKRLVAAAMHYTKLDIHNNKDAQDKFISFINDIYRYILDDYAHLVKKHDNLQAINKALKVQQLFTVCDINKCSFTSRHHATDNNESKSFMDIHVQFYARVMDSFHFYVLHLFDCGLRTKTLKTDDDQQYDDKHKYFDEEFTKISKIIHETQHLRASFNRLKNNKYNIKTTTRSTDAIYLDEVIRHLLVSKVIRESTIRKFCKFLSQQHYDTDSMKRDIRHELWSNIHSHIDDQEALEMIAEFVTATELRSSGFSVGLPFYYWPAYKEMEEFDQNTDKFNINNHGGHTINDLCVAPKHQNLKEEAMNCQWVNVTVYNALDLKVQHYMQTKHVKEMTAYIGRIELKYEIEPGDKLLSDHLVSLFLYTDFSNLCTAFSETFRAVKQFETLKSIKSRNAKYYWMARRLRELVELYGDCNREINKARSRLFGPFYSGVSSVKPFPEFEVRLCGPTSTSKEIEIALHFAGSNGVVVQLNSDIYNHTDLKGFQCGWLSDFKEENEVLFFGGHYRITIQSVRVLKGTDGRCHNFKSFFAALCKFNKMFNGDETGQVTENEKSLILSLVDWILNDKDLDDTIDSYVRDTFMLFTQHKQHVVYNYFPLYYNNDKDLRDMMFYEMKRGSEFKQEKYDKTNIFRKNVFELFKNIKNIDIYTTPNNGNPKYQCVLSFEALLSEIEKENWKQVVVKAVKDVKKNESWIDIVWRESSKELEQMYKHKGLQISLENAVNHRGYVEDCVVIEKI